MTQAQFYLLVAVLFVAPHLPKATGWVAFLMFCAIAVTVFFVGILRCH